MAKQASAAEPTTSQQKEQLQQDILLLHDKIGKALEAVTKLDPDGKHESIPFDAKENNSFLRIDKLSSIMENFWKNLVSQFKDPTRFNLISIKDGELDDPQVKKALKDLSAGKETREVKDFLEKYEIRAKTPEQVAEEKIDWDALKKMGITREGLEKSGMLGAFIKQAAGEEVKMQETPQQAYRYSDSLVPWSEFEKMGIPKEMLIQKGYLDQMLKGFKTSDLIPLTLTHGPAVVRMEARLSLIPDQEHGLKMYINGVKKFPDLDQSFRGHVFSDGGFRRRGNSRCCRRKPLGQEDPPAPSLHRGNTAYSYGKCWQGSRR